MPWNNTIDICKRTKLIRTILEYTYFNMLQKRCNHLIDDHVSYIKCSAAIIVVISKILSPLKIPNDWSFRFVLIQISSNFNKTYKNVWISIYYFKSIYYENIMYYHASNKLLDWVIVDVKVFRKYLWHTGNTAPSNFRFLKNLKPHTSMFLKITVLNI
jgi:hypothetical protein